MNSIVYIYSYVSELVLYTTSGIANMSGPHITSFRLRRRDGWRGGGLLPSSLDLLKFFWTFFPRFFSPLFHSLLSPFPTLLLWFLGHKFWSRETFSSSLLPSSELPEIEAKIFSTNNQCYTQAGSKAGMTAYRFVLRQTSNRTRHFSEHCGLNENK